MVVRPRTVGSVLAVIGQKRLYIIRDAGPAVRRHLRSPVLESVSTSAKECKADLDTYTSLIADRIQKAFCQGRS